MGDLSGRSRHRVTFVTTFVTNFIVVHKLARVVSLKAQKLRPTLEELVFLAKH